MFLKNKKKKNKNLFKNRTQKDPAVFVRVDRKNKTLFLGEKKWKFEFTKTDIKNFLHRNIYRISLFTIFLASIVSVFVSSTSKASVTQFYAGSCLGGWENPGNSEGAPQVFDGSEEVFSSSNSAILQNSMSEIFCGNFRAEVTDKTAVKKAVLKLSWKLEENSKEEEETATEREDVGLDSESSLGTNEDDETTMEGTEATEPSEENPEKKSKKETTVIESNDFTSSLQDILDAPTDTPVDFILTPAEEEVPESEPEEPVVEVETPAVQSAEEIPETSQPAVESVVEEKESVPEESVLEEKVPEESVPEESVPEEAVSAESEPEAEETSLEEVSFFRKIFKTVWAAEIEEGGNGESSESETSIEPEPEPEPESKSEEKTLEEENEKVIIKSNDFVSSLQDILDAPVDALIDFTLNLEEKVEKEMEKEDNSGEVLEEAITPLDSEVTSIESNDFVSSLQDILDVPNNTSVDFTLTLGEIGMTSIEYSNLEETGTTSVESDISISEVEVSENEETETKSEVFARDNDFLEVEYTLDSVNWQHLGFVGSDNLEDTELELPIVEWDELEKLQVRIKNLPTMDEQPKVYLDSMWIEVTHSKEKILRPAKLENLSLKNGFSFNDDLKFDFEFEEEEATGINKILNPIKNLFSSDRKFNVDKVRLINVRGGEEEIESSIEYSDKKNVSITIKTKNRSARPGKYVLETYIKTDNDEEIIKQQDFYLGVLAINVDKSIYKRGEQAYLQLGALTDNGHTICDADLWMSVIDPDGMETDFSIEDGSINLSGECSGDSFVNVPDYFAYYDVSNVGTYKMRLINLDTGQEIEDHFEVRKKVSFEVKRTGPTRIYPPAKYQVTMSIVPDQDFNGDIVEYVPDSFEIAETSLSINNGSSTVSTSENITIGKSEKEEKTIEIVWSANLKKGETCILSYEFDAPDISPEFYLLGPLEFYE